MKVLAWSLQSDHVTFLGVFRCGLWLTAVVSEAEFYQENHRKLVFLFNFSTCLSARPTTATLRSNRRMTVQRAQHTPSTYRIAVLQLVLSGDPQQQRWRNPEKWKGRNSGLWLKTEAACWSRVSRRRNTFHFFFFFWLKTHEILICT